MKAKLTLAEKAKRQREIVSERRRNGICVICGKKPMGTNQDGTTSVRCVDCREQMAGRKERYRNKLGIAPVRRDTVEFETYYETQEFKRYELIILGILETAEGAMGTSEIKSTWPDGNHRWLLDTLSRLESVGLVESFQWGARRGYRKSEPRRSTLAVDTVKQNEYKAHLRFRGMCYPTEAMIRGVV